MSALGDRPLLGPDLAVLLPVDADHLVDVARDVGLGMGEAAGDLALREVRVAGVHRLELAAVDGDAIAPQHARSSGGARRTARGSAGWPGPLSRRKSAMDLL